MANVPKLPGVPALPGYSNALGAVQLFADALGLFSGSIAPQWGLFQNGLPVILADSVISMNYKQGWSIADYQVEDGGFESYDKVENPFEVQLRFSRGGSEADRQAFLDSIAAIADDLNLYDVVTPEVVYTSVNISRYDYRRTSNNGNGLIVVDIWFLEIRVTAEAAFSSTAPTGGNAAGTNNGDGTTTVISIRNPQDPTASSPVNGGTVQATTPTQQDNSYLSQMTNALAF